MINMANKVREITDEQIEFARNHSDVKTLNDLCYMWSISKPTLRQKLPADVLKLYAQRRIEPLTEEQLEYIRENHKELTFQSIAEMLNVSERVARKVVPSEVSALLVRHKSRPFTEEEKNYILSNLQKPKKQMASSLGIAYSVFNGMYDREIDPILPDNATIWQEGDDQAKRAKIVDIMNKRLSDDEQFGDYEQFSHLCKKAVRFGKTIKK